MQSTAQSDSRILGENILQETNLNVLHWKFIKLNK